MTCTCKLTDGLFQHCSMCSVNSVMLESSSVFWCSVLEHCCSWPCTGCAYMWNLQALWSTHSWSSVLYFLWLEKTWLPRWTFNILMHAANLRRAVESLLTVHLYKMQQSFYHCSAMFVFFFVQWLDKWSASGRQPCCCWQHYDNYSDVLDSFVRHYVSVTDKGKSHPMWHDPHSFSLKVLVILSAIVSLLLFTLLQFLTWKSTIENKNMNCLAIYWNILLKYTSNLIYHSDKYELLIIAWQYLLHIEI